MHTFACALVPLQFTVVIGQCCENIVESRKVLNRKQDIEIYNDNL